MMRCAILIWSLCLTCVSAADRPHIVFILADDLGWNDVSFHGSDHIPTANIDALAFSGIILNQYYMMPICTPSRAALMTGRYPIHTGMQGDPIDAPAPWALPEGPILPDHLKKLGYTTRAIGKWHLGFYRKQFTPTFRGFDSHLGYWDGFIGYWDYISQFAHRSHNNRTREYCGIDTNDVSCEADYDYENEEDEEMLEERELREDSVLWYNGFDLRRDLRSAWEYDGQYSMDVFTNEAVHLIQEHNQSSPLFLYLSLPAPHHGNHMQLLEAPADYRRRFLHIPDPAKRTYAAMVSKLDDCVGEVVAALGKSGMLQNSIIVFSSDNGAPEWGSNWPLRGVKYSLWEGGVRAAAAIWSPFLDSKQRISSQLFHVTDWLPTLFSAAGGDELQLDVPLDGVNMWKTLSEGTTSPRKEILLNIDEQNMFSAIRIDKWKFVNGTRDGGAYDGFYGTWGREIPIPPYDLSLIQQSPTGQALIAAGFDIPSVNTMDELRSEATIKCAGTAHSNCYPANGDGPCLFDLENDPCETTSLAAELPDLVEYLFSRLSDFEKHLIPQRNVPHDQIGSDPRRWNNTWAPWYDCLEEFDPVVCN